MKEDFTIERFLDLDLYDRTVEQEEEGREAIREAAQLQNFPPGRPLRRRSRGRSRGRWR